MLKLGCACLRTLPAKQFGQDIVQKFVLGVDLQLRTDGNQRLIEVVLLNLRESARHRTKGAVGIQPLRLVEVGICFGIFRELDIQHAAREIQGSGFRHLRQSGVDHVDSHLKGLMREGQRGKIQIEVYVARVEQHGLSQNGNGLRRLSQCLMRGGDQFEGDRIRIRGSSQRFERGHRFTKASSIHQREGEGVASAPVLGLHGSQLPENGRRLLRALQLQETGAEFAEGVRLGRDRRLCHVEMLHRGGAVRLLPCQHAEHGVRSRLSGTQR